MLPISLRRARTHNLKGIDLDLEPGTLVALTGPSGAGKSSLALDTLYAEGQRRFVESFSPYARQFLERLERPPVDSLEPIAATVAVDRRAPVKSSRSTLATVADLEAYLGALFASEAVPVCGDCKKEAVATTAHDAATQVVSSLGGKRGLVTYPLRVETALAYLSAREELAKSGYRRLVVGGVMRDIDDVKPSEAAAPNVRVEVVVDRLQFDRKDVRRLQQAIEAAWERAAGRAEIRCDDAVIPVHRGLVCDRCGKSFDPPTPGRFSYNSPLGACATCRGFGRTIDVDWDKVIPDPDQTIAKGAIRAWAGKSSAWERRELLKYCDREKIPTDVPWQKLSASAKSRIIEGEGSWKRGKFPGVRAWFKWLETRTYKMHVRVFLARYREYVACKDCGGGRLNTIALSYRVAGLNLAEWHAQTVGQALERTEAMTPKTPQGARVRQTVLHRLRYLDRVGLGYLTLDRQARTLSGGESQRAGLTTALGTGLTGTLFVVDEPTVGLHATDVPPLAEAMRELASLGNTVLVVEHDRHIVEACDRVVELGPGAGTNGGRVLFDGVPRDLLTRADLPTGRAWQTKHDAARTQRAATAWLEVKNARAHNLAGVSVSIPLGVVCAITGPSGSGKSTLVEEVLYRAVARALGDTSVPRPLDHDALLGAEALKRVVLVDQSPLGRTARGNAGTYTKAWDRMRARFSQDHQARTQTLLPSHFSFNVEGGRCEACAGEGYETVEMQFLADVSFACPVCQGKRFRPEVLSVRLGGKNVADVLAMTIEEVLDHFDPEDDRDYVLARALTPAVHVGLGYLPLGQPLSMLSGGEAQRLKLARALSENAMGTLFIVDEPSAGLHAIDTEHVVRALHKLAASGASVVVVEHDLDVIEQSDWVIDLGPGGGPQGGRVVAEGTPREVREARTRTGEALRARAKAKGPEAKSRSTSRAPSPACIRVTHAREHNLKDVSLEIPHNKLVVVTGPSGSGKSSLAFDVVFAEGQRRFMETLTPYARQFLPTLPRPDVDDVSGVPPAIALEQRTTRAGAHSTVATVTEVAHYLRLLYAKVGTIHCPSCEAVVEATSADDIFERLTQSSDRRRHTVYSPAVRARKGTYLDLFTAAARAGVQTARVDGAIVSIDPPPKLAKTKEHSIDLIVHFGALADLSRATFDRALGWSSGALLVAPCDPTAKATRGERLYSTSRACSRCGTGLPELDPRWFSFNTKQGQCEACEGTGLEGGSEAFYAGESAPCSVCEGSRLAEVPRRVRLHGETYAAFTARDVAGALGAARRWAFSGHAAAIAHAPHGELVRRLQFIVEVGLGYLSLDRIAATLSGGEMQRLRLSAQLGSGLTGTLYVLDEPTIGLHPRDTEALLENLRRLVRTGSTVLVVEHDAETIRAADHLIDLGPSGGSGGGHVLAQGAAKAVLEDENSPTGLALRESARITRPKRGDTDTWLELRGAAAHNLKNVTFRVPTGRMCVVAGVSGSGKSTLVRHVFLPALRHALHLVAETPGRFKSIHGVRSVKRALAVDQSPIGRTPRSVPATFLGVWDDIRRLFASMPEAKTRGFGPARFSFNTPSGGRCPGCDGQGAIVHEMSFLPDVVSPCESCGGARFEPATLDVRFKDKSIGDVLRLSAEEAAEFFHAHPRIARPLQTLHDLGVGYLQLGQGSNTLSGGEAQRLKLAAELTAKSAHEPTVYVLDEPTTGLHLADVRRLLMVLERLVERGDTLVIIEHHPDVIACADWVVELGPEAGISGGQIVFEGTPGELARAKTATGRHLGGKKLVHPPSRPQWSTTA